MPSLLEKIRTAVRDERVVVSWHADEKMEERGASAWQLVAGFEQAQFIRERPQSKPNPSVIVRQLLMDGSEVEVIWSWLPQTQRAKLVTVYFKERQ